MYNVGGQIGGDSDLSPQGWKYAEALPALIKENVGEDANLEVSFFVPGNILQKLIYARFGRQLFSGRCRRDHSSTSRKRRGNRLTSLMLVSVMV